MVVGVTVSVCQRLLLDNVGNDLCILFLRANAGQSLDDPMLAYVQNMHSMQTGTEDVQGLGHFCHL